MILTVDYFRNINTVHKVTIRLKITTYKICYISRSFNFSQTFVFEKY